jgi:uncharacterized membrane protein YhaH (DUF805 family)
MSAVNPFQPPRAEVSDVYQRGQGFQEPKVWSAKGRVGRLRYLAYPMAASFAFMLLLMVAGGMAGAVMGSSPSAVGGVTSAVGVLVLLGYIPLFVLMILTAIQRCHDLGWSGWIVLLSFIPLINLPIMLMWIFKAGTPGANRYGPPPAANPTSVKVLAFGFPVIMTVVIGSLAAVAIPQYQTYVKRAQAAQAAQGQQAPTSLQGEASR